MVGMSSGTAEGGTTPDRTTCAGSRERVVSVTTMSPESIVSTGLIAALKCPQCTVCGDGVSVWVTWTSAELSQNGLSEEIASPAKIAGISNREITSFLLCIAVAVAVGPMERLLVLPLDSLRSPLSRGAYLTDIDIIHIACGSGRVQAPDCGAPASRFD